MIKKYHKLNNQYWSIKTIKNCLITSKPKISEGEFLFIF